MSHENARDAWLIAWADRAWRDAKYGVRGLRREPTFALASILTLALGVGATTSVFSIADAELWKPLPYPNPEQLVGITSHAGERAPSDGISGADLLDWREAATSFSHLAFDTPSRQVLQLQTAESVLVSEVTANYFTMLGRSAVLGRTFDQSDARGPRLAVVTERAWQRLFNGDPAVIGRPLQLDGEPAMLVGVVAADDWMGSARDLFLSYDEASPAFLDRTRPVSYAVLGRLRPGLEAEAARAQLQTAATRLAEAHGTGREKHRIEVADLRTMYSGYNWRPLYFFLGASLVVLVLSTINVAMLLVSRAIRRRREFALRGALGGGQSALAGQLLMEGLLLAIPGGALGILLAFWMLGLLLPALPADFLGRGSHIALDLRVGAFTLAASGLSTLVFALVPLPVARRMTASATLRDGGRSGQSSGEGYARSVLLTAQIALTVILLAGAGILTKSFLALTQAPLGFDPTNLAALRVTAPESRYATDATLAQYAERLRESARAVAGVRIATIGTSSPLNSGPLIFFVRPDRQRPPAGEEPRGILRAVDGDYFQTTGITLLRGRAFTHLDGIGAPRVAIVNATLAQRVFGPDDPIGQFIELLPGRAPWTRRPGQLQIVGIAANAKEVGINEVDFAGVYVPFAQMPASSFELIVRTETPAAGLAMPLRAAAAEIDPAVPVTRVTTFDQRVWTVLQEDRLNLLLVGSFALLAIALSAIGVYGVAAYNIQARSREFGIRLALGARSAALIRSAVLRSGRLAAIGAIIGLAATLAIARLLGNALYLVPGEHSGLLYGVTTTDPAMLASALVGVLLVATAAAGVPARRISRVDPAETLRSE
ncbi:MAG TPA: ABC transporter permease [Vicinamibacterales bacterium]